MEIATKSTYDRHEIWASFDSNAMASVGTLAWMQSNIRQIGVRKSTYTQKDETYDHEIQWKENHNVTHVITEIPA